jgi:hypothetical protein
MKIEITLDESTSDKEIEELNALLQVRLARIAEKKKLTQRIIEHVNNQI